MSEKISILDSGRMTQEFQYNVKVNGRNVTIRESIDLDVQNGTYGKTDRVIYKKTGQGGNNWNLVSPDSTIGEAIAADADGVRGNTYRNTMTDLEVLSGKQALSNVVTHQNALRESGMFDIANGDKSHTGTEFPDKTKFVDNTVTEEDTQGSSTTVAGLATNTKKNNKPVEHLWYPDDLTTKQDYILIESFEYTAPQTEALRQNKQVLTSGSSNSPNRSARNKRGSGFNKKNQQKYKNVDTRSPETQKKYGFANTVSTGLGRGQNANKKDLRGTVKLPIPNAIKSSNGVDWGEARVNALEAGAFLGVQNQISNVLGGNQNLAGALKSGVDGLKETFEKLPEIGRGQSGQLISSVLSRTVLQQVGLNVDPSQMIARSTGMAINPNLELLFSSPKLRTFTFVFQFAPDTEEDAVKTRKIQRFFKQGMLPSKDTSSNGDRLYLGSPHVYRLCYKNDGKRIKGLNIFKICALTSCEINFTPENVYQAYEDSKAISMPVRSFMTLTFTELTPIFHDDYEDGGEDPSLLDLGRNIQGTNSITDQDIGF